MNYAEFVETGRCRVLFPAQVNAEFALVPVSFAATAKPGGRRELARRLSPDGPLGFTRNDLDLAYFALTAHFGRWVKEAGKRKVRWQVATDPLSACTRKSSKPIAAAS